ncbi:MAG TPA: hypothetical protein VFK05_15815 [Polyangiaceae bacterium]|nr:hypothetical protein [Polyangiaceae bacterium]
MPAPNSSFLDSQLLEPLLLRKASRRARALTNSARTRMKPWVTAARARYSVALELRDRKTQTVALGLLREAAFFALCALAVAESSAAPQSSPGLAWQAFDQLPEAAEAPAAVSTIRSAFACDDALAIDALDQTVIEQLRPAAEQTVAWLLSLAEVQTPQRLTRLRRLRTLLLTVGVTVIGWTLLSYWLALAALAHPSH